MNNKLLKLGTTLTTGKHHMLVKSAANELILKGEIVCWTDEPYHVDFGLTNVAGISCADVAVPPNSYFWIELIDIWLQIRMGNLPQI